jgi:hypothetical protein
MPRARAEQKYVVLLNDGTVVGTESGGCFTQDAAWLCERWYKEYYPEMGAIAKRLTPRLTNKTEEQDNG